MIRRPRKPKGLRAWGRLLGPAGALVVLVAGMVLSAPAAFTAGTPTGQEQITRPVHVPVGVLVGTQAWAPPVDSNANPINGIPADAITGIGYNTLATVIAMVCNGANPTSAGWSFVADCDPLSGSPEVSTGSKHQPADGFVVGESTLDPVGVFRGVGPNDQFNCLAPADNPNGPTVNVPNLPAGGAPASIDRTAPSWGSTLPLAPGVGGGTAPCQVRVSYLLTTLSTTADKFFPLALPQEASNIPPPVRTTTTVPNPNLPVTAPAGSSSTTSLNRPVTALGGASPTMGASNPVGPTTSTSAEQPNRSKTSGVSGTTGTGSATSKPCATVSGLTGATSTTTCTSSTQAARPAVAGRGAGSADSARGPEPSGSDTAPTTVQLVAASTTPGTTNSQAYWYLLAGAALCAIGVAAAELRGPDGGRNSLARQMDSERGGTT